LLKNVLRFLALIAIVVFAFWLSRALSGSDIVKNAVNDFGYLGVFVVALVSGFNVIVPIPAIVFLPLFTASGLSFWFIIVVVTIGMTIGDSIGYFLGDAGRSVVRFDGGKNKILSHIEKFKKRHRFGPFIFLFFYAAFAPIPNEAIIIPMSFAGYRFVHVFPIVLLGNFLFNITAAGVLTGIAVVL